MDVVPSTTWRTLDERMTDKPLPRGLDAFWDAGVGGAMRCVPRQKRFLKQAEVVLALEEQFCDMGSGKLREVTEQLRYLLDQLADEAQRQIALGKLEGKTNKELARDLGISLRAVERKLAIIRDKWRGEQGDE